MSTPGGPERPYDPTAPSPSPPADGPVFENPSFAPAAPYDPAAPYEPPPTYEPPPSYEPTQPPRYDPAPTYEPTQSPPAEPGYYLAPPPASALPPLPGGTYPTEPTYSPTSGYPSGSTGPGRTPRGAVVAIVLGAVVVLALAVVGVGLALRSGDERPVAAPTLPTFPVSTPSFPTGSATAGTTPPGSTSPGSTSPGTAGPTSAAEVTVPAVTPGFQGALSPKENVAYDVPPGWEIRTPGTLVGFADNDGKPVAVMHGVSTYRRDACPDVDGSNRGNAGFKTAGTLDPAEAAPSGVQAFAQAAALNEDGSTAPVTVGPVVDVRVAQGTITATMATATLTPPADAPCGAPQVLFTAVAFRTPDGRTALFVMYLDQGTPDSLSPAQAQQIVSSLRPYSG